MSDVSKTNELIAEAREALGRINIHAFPDDLAYQYRGGVLGRNVTEILRDVADALEAAGAERDEAINHRLAWCEREVMRSIERDDARAERDAAVAVIERVRAAVSGHPECDRYEEGDVISCGWKSAYASVVAALDGAPEPEEKP